MANYKSKPQGYGAFVAPYDMELLNKSILIKQNKYDVNKARVDASLNKLAGINLAKKADNDYLHQNLNSVLESINSEQGIVDYSNTGLTKYIEDYMSGVVDDKVLSAYQATQNLKTNKDLIEKWKSEGDDRYSQSNEYWFNNAVQSYLNNDIVGQKFNSSYIPHVNVEEYKKKQIEFLKSNFGNREYEIIDPNNQWAKKVIKVKDMSDADMLTLIENDMPDNIKMQHTIDGVYKYRGVDDSVIQEEFLNNKVKKISKVSNIISNLSSKLKSSTDKSAISSLKDKIATLTNLENTLIESAKGVKYDRLSAITSIETDRYKDMVMSQVKSSFERSETEELNKVYKSKLDYDLKNQELVLKSNNNKINQDKLDLLRRKQSFEEKKWLVEQQDKNNPNRLNKLTNSNRYGNSNGDNQSSIVVVPKDLKTPDINHLSEVLAQDLSGYNQSIKKKLLYLEDYIKNDKDKQNTFSELKKGITDYPEGSSEYNFFLLKKLYNSGSFKEELEEGESTYKLLNDHVNVTKSLESDAEIIHKAVTQHIYEEADKGLHNFDMSTGIGDTSIPLNIAYFNLVGKDLDNNIKFSEGYKEWLEKGENRPKYNPDIQDKYKHTTHENAMLNLYEQFYYITTKLPKLGEFSEIGDVEAQKTVDDFKRLDVRFVPKTIEGIKKWELPKQLYNKYVEEDSKYYKVLTESSKLREVNFKKRGVDKIWRKDNVLVFKDNNDKQTVFDILSGSSIKPLDPQSKTAIKHFTIEIDKNNSVEGGNGGMILIKGLGDNESQLIKGSVPVETFLTNIHLFGDDARYYLNSLTSNKGVITNFHMPLEGNMESFKDNISKEDYIKQSSNISPYRMQNFNQFINTEKTRVTISNIKPTPVIKGGKISNERVYNRGKLLLEQLTQGRAKVGFTLKSKTDSKGINFNIIELRFEDDRNNRIQEEVKLNMSKDLTEYTNISEDFGKQFMYDLIYQYGLGGKEYETNTVFEYVPHPNQSSDITSSTTNIYGNFLQQVYETVQPVKVEE